MTNLIIVALLLLFKISRSSQYYFPYFLEFLQRFGVLGGTNKLLTERIVCSVISLLNILKEFVPKSS